MSEQLEPEHSEQQPTVFSPPSVEELATLLPHYQIDYLIASGGMGAVYRGMQIDLDRPIAIKVLPPEAGNDAESINRFRSEARAMAKLNHSNIVSIYDFGVVESQCYFIMEFVEGHNLYELISTKEVTPQTALKVMQQVCDAMTYAHSKGIVHGDIKPSNIVLDEDGNVKLLDFGLARLMEHDHGDENWTPMGTPEYAAPELYDRSVVADHRADLYALGVVLYEMLMGQVPQGTFPLPTTRLQIDPRVDDIIVRCMKPEPEARYQNAAEIKQVLEDIRLGRPLPPSADALRPVLQTPNAVRAPVRRAPKQSVAHARDAVDRLKALEMEQKAKQKRNLIVGGCVAAAVAIAVGSIALSMMKKPPAPGKPNPTVVQPEPTKGEVKPAPAKVEPPKPETPKVTDSKPDMPKTEPPKNPGVLDDSPKTPENPNSVGHGNEKPNPAPNENPSPAEDRFVVLNNLKSEFSARYKAEVQDKMEGKIRDLGEKYFVQLDKLEAEFMNKADAGSVLQIRGEKERFQKTHMEPALAEISKIEKLAKLQGIMITAMEEERNRLSPAITKLNAEFSEALLKLQNQFASEGKTLESEVTKEFRDDGQKLPDYLAVIAGFRPKPPSLMNKGEVAEGNVALAKSGATADGGTNPLGLIDGINDKNSAGYGLAGDVMTITLPKAYRLAKVAIHLNDNSDRNYHYLLEGSADGNSWTTLADRSAGNWRGKQEIEFRPQPIKRLRIKILEMEGTDRFNIRELEAFCN